MNHSLSNGYLNALLNCNVHWTHGLLNSCLCKIKLHFISIPLKLTPSSYTASFQLDWMCMGAVYLYGHVGIYYCAGVKLCLNCHPEWGYIHIHLCMRENGSVCVCVCVCEWSQRGSERASEREIACVSLGKNGTSPVIFGADVYCRLLKLWNIVSSRQESVPVSFRPRSRPTPVHSEGCVTPERTSALEGTSPLLCSPTTVWEP